MARYMLWPGRHCMVYGIMAWLGIAWYVERHSITCFKALLWAIVPFTHGVADVNWRSCSHLPDLLRSYGTSYGPFYMHALFTRTAPLHSGQG